MTYQAHPLRVQRKRTKGWRMPKGAIYCGRPTVRGNHLETAEEYGLWLCKQQSLNDRGRETEMRFTLLCYEKSRIKGKQLACWCGLHETCHVDYLATWANR